jgi:tetratricopeptide (TPR) repeat protein
MKVTDMKTLVLALSLSISAFGSAGAGDVGSPSPAQLRIEAARKVLEKQPNRYSTYNDLAVALVRRARETSDNSYLSQAQAAIADSLRIQPDNFEAGQAHVALLLAEHNYRQALEEARALNHRMPDAVLVWGYMAEADAAIGDYDQAEQAAQWMMDLRPGNLPAFLCGAALREDWGEIDGALDFLSKAFQQTPPLETEESAWIMAKMARLHRLAGRPDAAEPLLQQALKTFPDYYLSLEELSEVRLAQQRYSEAVDSLARRNQSFPTAHSRYLAARALERAGKPAEAERMYAEFEGAARSQIEQPDNDNRELIAYYTEHARRPAEGLRIARLEMEHRHDVGTLDSYAWALYVNGQPAEARRQIQKALAVGTRDAAIYYHAGVIEAASGERSAALHYLQQSLDLNPTSEAGEAARRTLAKSGKFAEVRSGTGGK